MLSLTFPSGLCFEPSPGALAEVLTGLGEGRILDVGESSCFRCFNASVHADLRFRLSSTGSGVVGDWALKMGESFPRSQVIGVGASSLFVLRRQSQFISPSVLERRSGPFGNRVSRSIYTHSRSVKQGLLPLSPFVSTRRCIKVRSLVSHVFRLVSRSSYTTR